MCTNNTAVEKFNNNRLRTNLKTKYFLYYPRERAANILLGVNNHCRVFREKALFINQCKQKLLNFFHRDIKKRGNLTSSL